MPSTRRPKPLYQRGDFKLFERAGRANLEIVWYDASARRERSSSSGTPDRRLAELELDRRYLAATGQRICETCGRPFDGEASPLLATAIKDYLLMAEAQAGYKATKGRLAHVVEYLTATDAAATTCAQVDSAWVDRLRAWLSARPYSKGGVDRQRSLGSIEGIVLQLSAAINATPGQRARFKHVQMKEVASSPRFRADVPTLAAMFRYCTAPDARSPRERASKLRERASLLRYLRAAVATWARPEEIFDLGESQWTRAAGVLDLNPPGRRQTRKYRGRIPVPRQFAPDLDDCGARYMPVSTIRSTWDAMRAHLGLPGDREAGPKLIRRSMATLVRARIGEANWRQGEMMLGHVKAATSDIYAVPDPANLGLVLSATESIIAEICALTPGAYRTVTASGSTLQLIEGGKIG